MTLARWCRKYSVGARPYGPPVARGQALAVFTDDYRQHEDAGWELAHLTNYVVSSRVVLVPRTGYRRKRPRPD